MRYFLELLWHDGLSPSVPAFQSSMWNSTTNQHLKPGYILDHSSFSFLFRYCSRKHWLTGSFLYPFVGFLKCAIPTIRWVSVLKWSSKTWAIWGIHFLVTHILNVFWEIMDIRFTFSGIIDRCFMFPWIFHIPPLFLVVLFTALGGKIWQAAGEPCSDGSRSGAISLGSTRGRGWPKKLCYYWGNQRKMWV